MNDVEFILKEDIKEKNKREEDIIIKRTAVRVRNAAFPAIVCLKKKLKK